MKRNGKKEFEVQETLGGNNKQQPPQKAQLPF